MSNEKDTNDPTTGTDEGRDDADSAPSDPAGNGDDAPRNPGDSGSAPDDSAESASDDSGSDGSEEVWDDTVVIEDDPSTDGVGAGREESNGATTDDAEPTEGGIDELGSTVEVEGAEIDDDPDEDDLLGGLKIDTTAELEIPDRLVDQVIGQEHARDVIIKAAK
ncbi:ATP-dependent protease LonB, partial [Halorubrum sp. SD626R]